MIVIMLVRHSQNVVGGEIRGFLRDLAFLCDSHGSIQRARARSLAVTSLIHIAARPITRDGLSRVPVGRSWMTNPPWWQACRRRNPHILLTIPYDNEAITCSTITISKVCSYTFT